MTTFKTYYFNFRTLGNRFDKHLTETISKDHNSHDEMQDVLYIWLTQECSFHISGLLGPSCRNIHLRETKTRLKALVYYPHLYSAVRVSAEVVSSRTNATTISKAKIIIT
jgi:hypothetical protein